MDNCMVNMVSLLKSYRSDWGVYVSSKFNFFHYIYIVKITIINREAPVIFSRVELH